MILHVAEIARGLLRRSRVNAAFSRQIVVFALTAGLPRRWPEFGFN